MLHPALLILRRFEILDFWMLSMLSAMCRRTVRLFGPLSRRFCAWSSFMVTSRVQCRVFSIAQRALTTCPRRSAETGVLRRYRLFPWSFWPRFRGFDDFADGVEPGPLMVFLEPVNRGGDGGYPGLDPAVAGIDAGLGGDRFGRVQNREGKRYDRAR